MVKTNCSVCNTVILRYPSQLINRRPCCSRKCLTKIRTKFGEDNHFYKNSSISKVCLFCLTTFKTYRCLKDRKKYCSLKCRHAHLINPKLRSYKGGGYSSTHKWIVKKYGPALSCWNINCPGKSRHFDWANLDDRYERDVNTWAQLCKSCHQKMDRHKLSYSLLRTPPCP